MLRRGQHLWRRCTSLLLKEEKSTKRKRFSWATALMTPQGTFRDQLAARTRRLFSQLQTRSPGLAVRATQIRTANVALFQDHSR